MSSEYYTISNSTSIDIGKGYPQCKGVPDGYTFKMYDSERSMTNLNNSEFPNYEPELLFELREEAFETNIISPSNIMARGFLLDEKVEKILSQFKICEHRFYDANISNLNRHFKWMHIIFQGYESIDFEKSEFSLGYHRNVKTAKISINNLQGFLNAWEETKMKEVLEHIFFDRLILNQNFLNFDLFNFPCISMNEIIVSSRLKEAFELEEVSGIEFQRISG